MEKPQIEFWNRSINLLDNCKVVKVLFISFHNPNSLGVNKKVNQQLDFFKEVGIECKGVFLSEFYKETTESNSKLKIKLEKYKLPSLYNRRFIRSFNALIYQYFSEKRKYEVLLKAVSKESFDKIYFRYPGTTFSLLKFVKKYKNQIVFEHNTKELEELNKEREIDPELEYNLWCEKNLSRKVFSMAKGVAVSSDFSNYENTRAGYDYCNFVYPNPIDVSSFKERKLNGDGVYKLFVMIGSYDHWHGLDLLVDAIVDAQKVDNFELYYVGRKDNKIEKILSPINAKFVGTSDQINLEDYYSLCDVAIGSLAFHRLNITESSSLKTKEYLANGIPLVISAEDVAFKENREAISPYFLLLNNGEAKLDLNALINFIERIRGDVNHSKKIRNFSELYLDFRPIYKNLKSYIFES